MHSNSVRRLVLVTVLATGMGLATEAAAFATVPSKHTTSVAEKKKKKKPTIKIANSDLGQILVDSKGRTVYAFDPNGTDISVSHCTGACATAWPPVKSSKPKAGKGLDATKLQVGAGGQVAYNGHLLHDYSGDSAPGDTNGNGIGGVWHALNAQGEPVQG